MDTNASIPALPEPNSSAQVIAEAKGSLEEEFFLKLVVLQNFISSGVKEVFEVVTGSKIILSLDYKSSEYRLIFESSFPSTKVYLGSFSKIVFLSMVK